ncbi:TetR/AcrR family transcriptional regulator [Pseudorhodoplanes sp.]|uniref:TetR/AcrR family transcriptional regulator n=1 Tax=Pseudorhodoplanes sp. TaxID=1934341 RepID=UPI003D0FA9C6
MARTRSENYDDIRQSILTGAVNLISRQGYTRTTVAELADACKLSRGALYHYFDSKEAILFAILDTHVRDLIARLDTSLLGISDPYLKFQRAVRTIVEINAKSPKEQRILLYDIKFLSKTEQKAIYDLERRIVDKMAECLVHLDRKHNITARTRKVYTMLVFGMINYTFTWFDPKGEVSPAEFADMAVQLFLNGLHSKLATTSSSENRKSA